eukprot:CAMPEP_0181211764 /NCGR_PEP_ID=MMETSP1096-20121128/23974_1 /TAXON_ID=156174 ORGANISM="Chrysochromulina ericina, Strain CCMP281" /NCGR_SAMPLE_ID=MMETSP1096 /ASSEMBLY_ACC=CAM_ASM_000453 /LENGTH=118 /DNA_ID=CAMNT_0023303215 /DNA_START=344 /DNA_END=700 /DNA_ORIENTATION=+
MSVARDHGAGATAREPKAGPLLLWDSAGAAATGAGAGAGAEAGAGAGARAGAGAGGEGGAGGEAMNDSAQREGATVMVCSESELGWGGLGWRFSSRSRPQCITRPAIGFCRRDEEHQQ